MKWNDVIRKVCLVLASSLLTPAFVAQASGINAAENPSRGVFPGAHLDKDSAVVLTRDLVLRMPGTSKDRADLPKGTQLNRVKAIKLRSQGKVYEVELWGGIRPEESNEGGWGNTVAVLAVIPEGAKAPTDVAEVKLDRETYLDEHLLSLGEDEAFQIFNTHLNTGEEFNITSLFHLRDGRLRRIAEIFTKGERAINCAESFTESLHWELDTKGDGMPNIVAHVEKVIAPKNVTNEDCPKRKIKERRLHSRTTYRWDGSKERYVKDAAKSR